MKDTIKDFFDVMMLLLAVLLIVALSVGCAAVCIGGFCGLVVRAFEAVQ